MRYDVSTYNLYKWLHVLGVILILGNVTVTAVWKVFADRTGNPRIVAFGQRLVTITDWAFTVTGIVFIMVGGFGATAVAGAHPMGASWLRIGELLFGVSGAIWLLVLVPTQMRQAKQARLFADGDAIPAEYQRESKRWLTWGVVATIPLIAAVWVMIAKPA